MAYAKGVYYGPICPTCGNPQESGDLSGTSLTSGSTCEWSHDEGISEAECGEMFSFNDGDAKDNGFKFCPYCGGKIEFASNDHVESEETRRKL